MGLQVHERRGLTSNDKEHTHTHKQTPPPPPTNIKEPHLAAAHTSRANVKLLMKQRSGGSTRIRFNAWREAFSSLACTKNGLCCSLCACVCVCVYL